ncbi:hypothetical protein JOE44_001577 [Chryseobacterium sp. PvR013]|uniref:hypothetical protein n=1 Tax=Chryseobacterium sp. PvR013 TaxID=2806595 RepID=UPI001AE30F1F|nr:hypothetical protein [Chryseobacterium sp. PvR013]MBP1164693.1 hypothetical protein [Chryseobacterium sp. PvR013]
MDNKLQEFLILNGNISQINSDSFVYELEIEDKDVILIKDLYDDFIETIKTGDGKIINIEDFDKFLKKKIFIEFVTAEIRRIGFYISFNDFILHNRYQMPKDDFYIFDLTYSSINRSRNEQIEKYEVTVLLIDILTNKSKFTSEDNGKTVFLLQENSVIEIPIENIVYEEYLDIQNIHLLKQYVRDIDSYKEKNTIYLKQLIDFLKNKSKIDRFKELLLYFEEFYEKCNVAFEYYLSNFSVNKIQLELDNSVLEYSKNIRSIINDSQSKLIAIPAAFILGVTQIDYTKPFLLKNFLIIFSTFIFSYIISIFIKNQKNAIDIISDNLNNYKINYKHSKSTEFESEKELEKLSSLINNSYKKTEDELLEQENRLSILQICNWGISIALALSVIISFLVSNCKKI